MWKVTAEYTDLTGTQSKVRCVIECPEGHPYDVMKQTLKQAYTKRCKICKETFELPTIRRKNAKDKSDIIEVNDCFDHSYEEIAAYLDITVKEAKTACDEGMFKLLALVADDPELAATFSEYLGNS